MEELEDWEEPVEFPIDQTIDLYQILGLPYGASLEDVKNTFRNLSQELHPDKHMDKSEEFQKEKAVKFAEVAHAYGILSDDKLRDLYLKLRNGFLTMGQEKISRNSICPCGSKLKFKKCCLNKS